MGVRIRLRWRLESRGCHVVAWLGLWLGCAGLSSGAAPNAERFVAAAWSDPLQARGVVQRFHSQPPWAFDGDAISVGRNPTLRFAHGRLYAVSDADGSITAIDCSSWSVAQVYSLGAQSYPLDIAVVSPTLAYVTTGVSTALLRLDLGTGALKEALNFDRLAHPGGTLLAGMMAIDAGRLFVQIARFDALAAASAQTADPTAYLAVVDIASEEFVDADPNQVGSQAIALLGTYPKYKMSLLRDTRRLYVSASGAYFDDGGLEEVDLDALASLGLVIAEVDGNTASDLGSFVMVALDRGFLVSSTGFAPSSHLARFSLAGGALPEELWVTVDYRVPSMIHDPQSDTIFVPDGGFANGVWVFGADTGERGGGSLIPLGGRATDVELLCQPTASCDCAVGYSCEAVPAASSISTALLSLFLMLAAAATLRSILRNGFSRQARDVRQSAGTS